MKNVLEYLETAEKVFPEKTGVIDETGAYSFVQLAKKSRHVGTGTFTICDTRAAGGGVYEKEYGRIVWLFRYRVCGRLLYIF